MSRMSTTSVPLPYFPTQQNMTTKENITHTHNPFLGYLTRIHGATKLIVNIFSTLIKHPHNAHIHTHTNSSTHIKLKLSNRNMSQISYGNK